KKQRSPRRHGDTEKTGAIGFYGESHPFATDAAKGWAPAEMARRFDGGKLGCAADEGPVFDTTPVAGLPVRVSGFDGEAGVDGEVHGGLVGEAHLDYVVVARGIELDEVDGFAPDLFKAMEATVAIAADSRLPAPGDYWRPPERARSACV